MGLFFYFSDIKALSGLGLFSDEATGTICHAHITFYRLILILVRLKKTAFDPIKCDASCTGSYISGDKYIRSEVVILLQK